MEVYIVPYLQLSVTVYVSVHFVPFCIDLANSENKISKDFTANWAEYIKNKRILSLTNEKLTAKKYILISEHLKRQIFHTSVCACALGRKNEMLSGMANSVTFRSQFYRYLWPLQREQKVNISLP